MINILLNGVFGMGLSAETTFDITFYTALTMLVAIGIGGAVAIMRS